MKKQKIFFLVWGLFFLLLGVNASWATTSEVQKYFGWWKIESALSGVIPFEFIEITAEDGGTVYLYDREEKHFMTGVLRHDTKVSPPKTTLDFKTQGLFSVELTSGTPTQMQVVVTKSAPKVPYTYLEKAPFAHTRPKPVHVEDAHTYLMDMLGKKHEGKASRATGNADIKGLTCKTFALGQNTPERFITLEHYAVCPKGGVYQLDIVKDVWMPFSGQ